MRFYNERNIAQPMLRKITKTFITLLLCPAQRNEACSCSNGFLGCCFITDDNWTAFEFGSLHNRFLFTH